MGDVRLELTPPRPGTRPDDGRACWAVGLIKPAAIGIAAVSVALCAGALTLLWLGPAHHPYGYDVSGDLVVGSLFPLAGALIAVREPGNRCSWVLLSTGLVAVSALSHEWAHDGLTRPGFLPLVPVAVWLSGWTFAPYWLQVTLLPVLFPDGKIPSRRWRRFVAGVLVVIVAATVVAMFKPDSDVEGLGVRNPLAIGPAEVGAAWHFLLFGPVLVLAFGAAPTALIALAVRQRHAVGRTRAQLQWLLLGFTACILLLIPVAIFEGSVPGVHYGLTVAFGLIPLAIAIAVVEISAVCCPPVPAFPLADVANPSRPHLTLSLFIRRFRGPGGNATQPGPSMPSARRPSRPSSLSATPASSSEIIVTHYTPYQGRNKSR